MSIRDEISRIRAEQAKATPGRWLYPPQDGRKNQRIPLLEEIVPEYSPTKPLVTLSVTAWKPDRGIPAIANAAYIANTCSPEDGYLTRALAALEIAVEVLEKIRPLNSYLWNGDEELNVGDTAEFALAAIEQKLRGNVDDEQQTKGRDDG